MTVAGRGPRRAPRPPQGPPRRAGERGLSLLEMLLAFGIFITVATGVSNLMMSTTETYGTGITISTLQGQARRVVDRIAEELMVAGSATFAPAPVKPFGASSLTFQRAVSHAAGQIVWSPVSRLRLELDQGELDDGRDNDGDGFVDEMMLVLRRSPAGEDEILCRGISEYLEGELPNGVDDNGNGLVDEGGLSLVLSGDTLSIRLTLEANDPRGRPLRRSVDTSIVLRN